MKPLRAFALSGLLSVGTTAAAWISGADPHPTVTGLPGQQAWPAAVAAAAPGHPMPNLGTARPAQVSQYFAALTPAQQAALAQRAPGVVGNLDGVPYAMRYQANERARGAEPRGQRPAGRLLGYDPRGDGRAIEVFGELATAQHIAVMVPGSGWRLDNLARPTGPTRANPIVDALALHDELRHLDPRARVAVVVWLGYDPPEQIDRQAARSERAAAGARALTRFLEGLPARAHRSLLCHSYGAVVCGRAAPDAPVDDLVALAAPGMGVGSAAGLRTSARVWAARTAEDPIRFVPHVRVGAFGHGADPTDARFGARVIDTGDAQGHDVYYDAGTESLTNLARIVLGHDAEVTLR
jgi:hypothetical protein